MEWYRQLLMPGNWADWSGALAIAGLRLVIAVALALAIHAVIFAILSRAARVSPSQSDDIVVARLRAPLRWSMVAVAVAVAEEGDPLLANAWAMLARFVVPALLGWVAFALVGAFAEAMDLKAESSSDPLIARSRQTRVRIFSRTIGFGIVFVTVALMLFAIPGVRAVGTTLLASAGLATLAVGAAAQPALKSLIAGIQIALTEPIRIGDYVVVDKESGRIEDIRLSYVVVRTGDERRLIVPTSKFLDATFENWTRVGGGITGSVVLPVKPGFEIAPIRAAYEAALARHPDWDRRTGSVSVAEVRVGSVELTLVMSAEGPAELARLRPAMREAMLDWMREHASDALCSEA